MNLIDIDTVVDEKNQRINWDGEQLHIHRYIYIYQINNARLYKHRHFIPVTFTACGTTAMRSRRSVKGT